MWKLQRAQPLTCELNMKPSARRKSRTILSVWVIGVGSYGSSGGGSVGVGSPSVKNVKEGTLVIHAIDPARNAEVWRGSASRELGKGNVEPAVVQSVVADMLSDFPARGGQP